MTTQITTTSFFAHLQNTNAVTLFPETSETLALDMPATAARTLCVADVWNIQRRKKTSRSRNRMMY